MSVYVEPYGIVVILQTTRPLQTGIVHVVMPDVNQDNFVILVLRHVNGPTVNIQMECLKIGVYHIQHVNVEIHCVYIPRTRMNHGILVYSVKATYPHVVNIQNVHIKTEHKLIPAIVPAAQWTAYHRPVFTVSILLKNAFHTAYVKMETEQRRILWIVNVLGMGLLQHREQHPYVPHKTHTVLH